MAFAVAGLAFMILSIVLLGRPELMDWLDDQTGMKATELWRRHGWEMNPKGDEARRRLMKLALPAALVVIGLGFVYFGVNNH